MDKQLSNKIREYSHYLNTDLVSFFYHFDWLETREILKMMKQLHLKYKLNTEGPNDRKSIVVILRKLMADSHASENDSVTISSNGIIWMDLRSGYGLILSYNDFGNNKWIISSAQGKITEVIGQGEGFNKMIDCLFDNSITLFMGLSPKNYYL